MAERLLTAEKKTAAKGEIVAGGVSAPQRRTSTR